ncbi:subunit 17 of mediator complex-domain-containing protein [Durotheca rogersii]|uniref:subunit 17 of mediator complex-domain-containing protein n=1 Tax=Durotheca rogersii TaxID=419775 RepID=UPI00221F4B50|nr:subunit 17 of mediator complex-domain-containing protein [Durotheca rogersii]KAI5867456.1 subunit 17 of mediator complex-domain-containing protein [Durotheca rogersii]
MASPFSLRPWPIGDKKPKNLGEFIARINTERGGFRNVTEAKLRDEIAAQENGHAEARSAEDSADDDDGDDDEDDDEDSGADKSTNAVAARDEFLRHIEFAHQTAMLSLDFVSLLLSKETPVQAGTTLSSALRDLVGIGTLGASKLKESNVTDARRQDDLAVAKGWRVMGIDNMVDSIVASAEKLEKEMELETKYWADVLSVSESNWAVCALPQERHTLGVRFGFAESASEFRNSSIAPLRRNGDGTARLDLGRIGGGSQRIRVTVKKNGVIVDQSPLPARLPEDAPLKHRVLEARNTIFHQELWYQLNREARTLLSSNVYSDASCISWKQGPETEMIFTLEDLAEPDRAHERLSDVDCSCTAFYTYMQFLLFQGHQQNYYKRSTIPHVPSSRATPPYAILRALIANAEYFRDYKVMYDFLDDLVATLRRAGVSTASCTLATQPLGPMLRGLPTRNAKMELNLINYLAGRLESSFELTITPAARIFIRARIVLNVYTGMAFGISLTPFPPPTASASPSSSSTSLPPPAAPVADGAKRNSSSSSSNSNNNNPAPANDAAAAAKAREEERRKNPLAAAYPPFDLVQDPYPYPSVGEAVYYVRQAAIRAVAQHLAETAGPRLGRGDVERAETVRGPGVAARDDEREARVDLVAGPADGRLTLVLDAAAAPGHPQPLSLPPEPFLPAPAPAAKTRWTWRADRGDDSGDGAVEALVRVLQGPRPSAPLSAFGAAAAAGL